MDDLNVNNDDDRTEFNKKQTFATSTEIYDAGLLPTPFNRMNYNIYDINSYQVNNDLSSSIDISFDSHEPNNRENGENGENGENEIYNTVIDMGDNDVNQMINEGTEIPSYNVAMDEIEDLLAALTVLSGLKEYDKLIWIDDAILIPNVQNPGPFRFIRRIYNVQNRTDMIDKLKKIIYKSIAAFKYSSVEVRLKTGLMSCITGLSNLALTYNEDKMISSQLIIIIQNIKKSISE